MINFFGTKARSVFLALVLFCCTATIAHPMPNSVIALDVYSKAIHCELHLPLKELQLAIAFDVTRNTKDLLKNHEQDLAKYIFSHFSIQDKNGEKWNSLIEKMSIATDEQKDAGKYDNLIIHLIVSPSNHDNIREFTLNYNAIMHQVVTHRALVTIRQDWENGKLKGNNTEIGTISIDINTLKTIPFKVNLAKGSKWKGFKSMVNLGMKHIYEGTDHLLFLLVLLLSAPLISTDNKWIGSGGTKYALIRILKIVTAFTIGHSITLITSSLGFINPNTKLVEIVIALSILFTAIHAIKPILPNKEIYAAAGFGLIHGLAFASILTNLNLETNKLIISLLGFNIGIELIQLLVIILIMPWLLILSSYRIYKWVRIFGATLAGIASIAWAIERYTGKSNLISTHLQSIPKYSIWLIFSMACFTIIYTTVKNQKLVS